MRRRSQSLSSSSRTPFPHIKFAPGPSAPEFAPRVLFAHELALSTQPRAELLPETLVGDSSRDGIVRFLLNNFEPASPIYQVVCERVADTSAFILLTNNWHRSQGDPVRLLGCCTAASAQD